MTIMNLSDALLLKRTRIVSQILTTKKVSTIFSRDLQYLAIAIIDKFFLILSKSKSLPNPEMNEYYYSISALIIAHKFGKNDSPGLRKILALLKKVQENEEEYQTGKMVRTEEEILQTINFEIPYTTCYIQLQNFISFRSFQSIGNEVQIKTTMKLLKEISLVSSEASIHPEVGKQLYELVEKKKSTERSKRLYKLVISLMAQKYLKVETAG